MALEILTIISLRKRWAWHGRIHDVGEVVVLRFTQIAHIIMFLSVDGVSKQSYDSSTPLDLFAAKLLAVSTHDTPSSIEV